MAHKTGQYKDGNDRAFTPREIRLRGKFSGGGDPLSNVPLKKLDQGALEKREKSGRFLLVTKETHGNRENGTAKKDPLDGTSSGFSPPPVPVDFGFDQLTGSMKK